MGQQMEISDIENPNEKEEVKAEPKTPESKVDEKQYVTLEELQKIQKQLNGLSYMGRKFDEITRKIDSLSTPPPPAATKPEDMDEYDKLVEKDWKAAVRKMAQEEAKMLREQERAEDIKKQFEATQLNRLEQAKRTVLDRYPQLNDEDSEFAQKYKQVLVKHPEYLSNEFGPVLAMREMEDEMRGEGKLDETTKTVVEKEVTRRARAGVTAVPKSIPSNSGKSTLSREEKDFCDFNGIKYDVYLRNKSILAKDKQAEV